MHHHMAAPAPLSSSSPSPAQGVGLLARDADLAMNTAREVGHHTSANDGTEPASGRRKGKKRARWSHKTLPFSCPLLTPKRGLGRLTDASLGSSIGPVFIGSNSRSGISAQDAATGGKTGVFCLLTGGLLVRIQPEESNSDGSFRRDGLHLIPKTSVTLS